MTDGKSTTIKLAQCIRTLRLKVKTEAYPWLNEDWIWIQLAGGNVLRALAEAERVAAKLRETRAASGVTFSPPHSR